MKVINKFKINDDLHYTYVSYNKKNYFLMVMIQLPIEERTDINAKILEKFFDKANKVIRRINEKDTEKDTNNTNK